MAQYSQSNGTTFIREWINNSWVILLQLKRMGQQLHVNGSQLKEHQPTTPEE
jgi:hypothetical protein